MAVLVEDVVREFLSVFVDDRVVADACVVSEGYVLGVFNGSEDLINVSKYFSFIPPKAGVGFTWLRRFLSLGLFG